MNGAHVQSLTVEAGERRVVVKNGGEIIALATPDAAREFAAALVAAADELEARANA